MRDCTQQSVLFEDTFSKPVHVAFDAESLSSDGGAMLLAQLDQGIGLTRTLLSSLEDARQPGKIEFTFDELMRQRTYAIALGYEDGIDANSLAGDPMMKLAAGRDPESDPDLASQSTISRFENAPSARQIAEMGRGMEAFVIDRLARRHRKAKVITLDFDSTVDPVHGAQQLSLFNGFYDSHCYLPLLGFISVDDEPEQHLFHARLRPGTVRCYRGVIRTLRRSVAKLRRSFPNARLQIRMDGGFYHPLVIDVLEELKLVYAVGMAKNATLKGLAEDWMTISRTLAERGGETQTLFGDVDYKARSWTHERRVVIKVEVVHYPGRTLKDNQRFVLTNRTRMSPENLYQWYCGRGDSENRIKELKHDLAIDRTSCCKFVANQFRVLMASTAFVLFQELRWRLRNTKAARSSVGKLRDMLLKVAVRVVTSCRRIVCHFPTHMPWADLWQVAARRSGAVIT
ncbi:MAG TPA: IS1380 family transposase [Gammaproteobacteria bacterium]|nr:IS1380 family transposase [Gammaproteobacteria bacterium]